MPNRICRTSEPFLYLSKSTKLFAILSEIGSLNIIFSIDRRITVIFLILVNVRTGCSFLSQFSKLSPNVSHSIRNTILCNKSCTSFFNTYFKGQTQNLNVKKILLDMNLILQYIYMDKLSSINFIINLILNKEEKTIFHKYMSDSEKI